MSDGTGWLLGMFNTFINKRNTQHPSGPKDQILFGRTITYLRWMSKYLKLSWNAPNMHSPSLEHVYVQMPVTDLRKGDICRDLME